MLMVPSPKAVIILLSIYSCVWGYAATEEQYGVQWTYSIVNDKAIIGSGSSTPAIPQTTSGTLIIPMYLGGRRVTSIGSHAFYKCRGITNIEIRASLTSIEGYAFRGCSGLKSFSIPEGVTDIPGYAFDGCSGLTSLTIPNSVTQIGAAAFYGCTHIVRYVYSSKCANC